MLVLILIAGCAGEVDPTENAGENENSSVGDAGDLGEDTSDVEERDVGTADGDAFEDDEDTDNPSPDADADTDDTEIDEPLDLGIDSIIPAYGTSAGGTPFIITGQGFTAETQVLFGSVIVDVDLIDTTLSGVTPPADGIGPVSVRAIDEQTGDDILVDGFEYSEPLRVQAVHPAIVPLHGGIEISVFGQGFPPQAQITIGDRPVMEQTYINAEHLRVIAPPHPQGLAELRVTSPRGFATLPDALEYTATVALHSLEPAAGTAAGGDTVLLRGARFDDDLKAFFGGVEATVLNVNEFGDEATIVTPAHAPGLVHVNIETGGDGAVLPQAFAYLDASPQPPSLLSVVPAQGDSAGGEVVTLVGSFSATSSDDIEVFFGAHAATILQVQDQLILVETPAASAGTVDVTVTYDDQDFLLHQSFTYHDALHIDGLSPVEGDASGGTELTISGSGFSGVESVFLGGKSLSFTIVDDETITFSTPSASGGPADLVIYAAGNQQAVLQDAYFFLAELEIWSHTPTRGATAGNTYVIVSGQGFTADTTVYFGDIEAPYVELLDPFNLAVRTPAQGQGSVAISAVDPTGFSTNSPDPYTYFNPGAPTGGAWGNPINGAVNVLVYTVQGVAIEEAFVMLSTSAETPYAGLTDANGMVTLSGPDILGEQTVTATAAEHSSSTIQRVNAENITIFLNPAAEGDGVFPPPPPMATFSGTIEGLDKIDRPDATQVLMATVHSTRPSITANIPDPGPNNVVLEDGPFTINTRVGDLALVAIGGLYDTVDQSFTPIRMGVARHLTAADGENYHVEIDLDIPLNQTLNLKYNDPPLADPGPDQNSATLFLDLGLDGVFGPMDQYTTDSELLAIEPVAALAGEISDGSYSVIASTSAGGAIPRVDATLHGLNDLSILHNTPPLTSTINVVTPASGQVPINGLVQWDLHGLHAPDLYYVTLQTAMREVIWEIFLNGSATSFRFPDFPDFSPFGMSALPLPYPGGMYTLSIFGISKDGVSADHYSYDDLNPATFRSYSIYQTIIGF